MEASLESSPRVVAYPYTVKPTFKQRLKAFFSRGAVRAFTDNEHFEKPTEIYIFKCPKGYWVLDYLHGPPPAQYLNCPASVDGSATCPCGRAQT